MMAIRLSTAIKWDSEEADDSIEHAASLEALRHIEGGFIVTPADEALAGIDPVIRRPGQHLYECIACRSMASDIGFKLGLAHRDSCPWLHARRKVDSLVDR